jgi:hypothetical protein
MGLFWTIVGGYIGLIIGFLYSLITDTKDGLRDGFHDPIKKK